MLLQKKHSNVDPSLIKNRRNGLMMQRIQEFNEQLYHKFVKKDSQAESVHSYNSGISSGSDSGRDKESKESKDGKLALTKTSGWLFLEMQKLGEQPLTRIQNPILMAKRVTL